MAKRRALRSAEASAPLAWGSLNAAGALLGLIGVFLFALWQVAERSANAYSTAIYPLSDADEWRYTACSRLVAHGYDLFTQVFSAQPPLLFLSLAAGMRLLGESMGSARLVEVTFALVCLAATFRLGWLLGGPIDAGVATLLLAVSPLFLVYGRAVEAEMPMMALTTLSLALVAECRRRESLWPALAGGLLLAAAILMKLFAVETLAPALWLLYRSGPLWRRRSAVFLLAVLLPVGVDFAFVAPTAQWQQVVAMHDAAAAATIPFVTPAYQVLGTFLLLDVGLTVMALAGIVALTIIRAYEEAVFLLLWVGGTLVMLLYFKPLFPHHPAIVLSGLAVAAGIGPAVALEGRLHASVATGVVAAGILLYVLAGYRLLHADRHIVLTVPLRHTALVSYIRAHTSPGQMVAVDDLSLADRAERLVVPPLCDPSNVRLYSGYLTSRDLVTATSEYHPALVVPSSGIFAQERTYMHWLGQHYRPVPAPEGTTAFTRR